MSIKKKELFRIVLIVLAAVCAAAYHSSTKALPDFEYPFASLVVVYTVGALLSFFALLFVEKRPNLRVSFQMVDWKSVIIGIAILCVETSYYYMYKGGSMLTITPMLVSIVQTLITGFVGIVLLKERPGKTNLVGIVMCLFGAFLSVL